MRAAWLSVLLLLLGKAEAFKDLLPSAADRAVDEAGAEALSSVLDEAPGRRCSLIYLTDSSRPSLDVFRKRLDRHAPFGVGVFETGVGGVSGTNTSLAQVIDEARKLRKLSWCVNVVVLSEDFTFLTAFAESSLQGRLLEWATRLMVVTRLPLQELHQLLKNYWTFSMMNTIVIHAGGAPRGPWCSVYTYLPYSPAGGQVKLVASWTPVKGLLRLTDLPFFYDKFSNFYGATMNVTAKDYKPYWFELKEEAADGSKKLTGMDYLLLETVAKALNFSIKVLPIANWAEALDRVVSKEAFITPVIHAVLRQRLKRFEYTIPYTYASYSLSMKMPELTPQWQSLYYPLAGIVWVSVVVVTGLMIVVMYVMNKVGDFSSPPRRLEPGTVVLEVVGALFSQNLFKTLPTTDPSRVLVVFWLIFAFVVGTAYRGNLTAALTLPKYPLKPETLSEVVEVVHKVTIEPWGKDYKTFFKESGTEVFMKLADMMELGPALLDGLQEATEDATAHMDSRAVLELNIAESFTRRDGTSELYVVRESAIPGMAAWPIPHDSPFKKNLDFCIRASLEAGLYEKWENDMLEMARRESRERQRRQQKEQPQDEEEAEGSDGGIQALTLVHMQGPLMLLLLGLLLGALAFLLEMVTSSKGREKRNNADL